MFTDVSVLISDCFGIIDRTIALLETLQFGHGLIDRLKAIAIHEQDNKDHLVVGLVSKLAKTIMTEFLISKTAVDYLKSNQTDSQPIYTPSLETLLRMGNRFSGHIKIPFPTSTLTEENDSFGNRVDYYMEISRKFVDPLGNELVFVWHGAHDDEQACLMQISDFGDIDSDCDIPNIQFGDIETFCVGKADVHSRTISGKVEQFVYGYDGYSLQTDETENRFLLSLTDELVENEVLAGCLKEWHFKRFEFSVVMALFISVIHDFRSRTGLRGDVQEEVRDLELELKSYAFEPPFEFNMVQNDLLRLLSQLNAIILNHSNHLENVEFISEDHKSFMLKKFEEEGKMARPHLHKCADAVVMLLNIFGQHGLLLGTLNPGNGSDMILKTINFRHDARRLCDRVQFLYDRYDRALRAAENRQPNNVLDELIVDFFFEDGNAETCSICLCDLFDDDAKSNTETSVKIVKTSCSHLFHVDCAKQWFHRSSTCPICRSAHLSSENSKTNEKPSQ